MFTPTLYYIILIEFIDAHQPDMPDTNIPPAIIFDTKWALDWDNKCQRELKTMPGRRPHCVFGDSWRNSYATTMTICLYACNCLHTYV
jgi:hypothetical protein